MNPFIPAATTTLQVVGTALSSVRAAKEFAKDWKDSELKEQIGPVFDALLDVRERVLDLDDENRRLKEQLPKRAATNRTPEFGYYYADADADPYCPKCYEGNEKQVRLGNVQTTASGGTRCRECGETYWERRSESVPEPRFTRQSGIRSVGCYTAAVA